MLMKKDQNTRVALESVSTENKTKELTELSITKKFF